MILMISAAFLSNKNVDRIKKTTPRQPSHLPTASIQNSFAGLIDRMIDSIYPDKKKRRKKCRPNPGK
jgi:hypothetical protein